MPIYYKCDNLIYRGDRDLWKKEMKNKLKEIECIICNEKVTEEISKLSHTHNYTETVVDATCTDKGFINMVFTDEEKALIKTTLVDNSAATTDNFVNKYVCNNTNDKVYLLSFMDLIVIYLMMKKE